MDKLFCIFLGGGFGSVLRYLVSQVGYKYFSHYFVGTFAVNIIGCFLMGFVMWIVINKLGTISDNFKLLLTVGFLGGLTTFSTFSYEAFTFIKDDKLFQGLGYIILSCFVCLICTGLGYFLSSKAFN